MTEQYKKYANELEKALAQFSENVNKIVTEMFIFEGKKEQDWEMKCPYECGDKHYCIQSSGDVFLDYWKGIEADNSFFSQGNIFPTKQAAELEAKRRDLLTRFRAFRDECNGDWKINSDNLQHKYFIAISNSKLECYNTMFGSYFPLFGYFENKEHTERAIELFGDEIKELFVDCEVQ